MIDLAAWGGVIAASRPCLKGFFVYSARPLTLNLLAGLRLMAGYARATTRPFPGSDPGKAEAG